MVRVRTVSALGASGTYLVNQLRDQRKELVDARYRVDSLVRLFRKTRARQETKPALPAMSCLIRAVPKFLWHFCLDVPCSKANLANTKGGEMEERSELVLLWVCNGVIPCWKSPLGERSASARADTRIVGVVPSVIWSRSRQGLRTTRTAGGCNSDTVCPIEFCSAATKSAALGPAHKALAPAPLVDAERASRPRAVVSG